MRNNLTKKGSLNPNMKLDFLNTEILKNNTRTFSKDDPVLENIKDSHSDTEEKSNVNNRKFIEY